MTDPYAPRNPVPQGYLPPADAYMQLPAQAGDPNDPLVNPPYAGIGGWFNRIGGVFKRSWKSMLAIFAITYVLPTVGLSILAVIGGLVFAARVLADLPNSNVEIDPSFAAVSIPLLVLVALICIVLFLYLQMAGYAAATYAVTREAAGVTVRLGESLGYGFRRGLGLLGWQIVVGLLVIVGVLFCILPGIYFYAATALVGPIYLFERMSPISRSFGIFNNDLGRVLGRLALLLLASIVAGVLTNVITQFVNLAFGTSAGLFPAGSEVPDMGLLLGAGAVSSALGLIIELPLTMLTFAGILLTYTEQRGFESQISTRDLATSL